MNDVTKKDFDLLMTILEGMDIDITVRSPDENTVLISVVKPKRKKP